MSSLLSVEIPYFLTETTSFYLSFLLALACFVMRLFIGSHFSRIGMVQTSLNVPAASSLEKTACLFFKTSLIFVVHLKHLRSTLAIWFRSLPLRALRNYHNYSVLSLRRFFDEKQLTFAETFKPMVYVFLQTENNNFSAFCNGCTGVAASVRNIARFFLLRLQYIEVLPKSRLQQNLTDFKQIVFWKLEV